MPSDSATEHTDDGYCTCGRIMTFIDLLITHTHTHMSHTTSMVAPLNMEKTKKLNLFVEVKEQDNE